MRVHCKPGDNRRHGDQSSFFCIGPLIITGFTFQGFYWVGCGLGNLAFTLLIGSFVSRVGYAPFFVALGFGDLIGAAVLWTMVKPAAELLREALPREAGA